VVVVRVVPMAQVESMVRVVVQVVVAVVEESLESLGDQHVRQHVSCARDFSDGFRSCSMSRLDPSDRTSEGSPDT